MDSTVSCDGVSLNQYAILSRMPFSVSPRSRQPINVQGKNMRSSTWVKPFHARTHLLPAIGVVTRAPQPSDPFESYNPSPCRTSNCHPSEQGSLFDTSPKAADETRSKTPPQPLQTRKLVATCAKVSCTSGYKTKTVETNTEIGRVTQEENSIRLFHTTPPHQQANKAVKA